MHVCGRLSAHGAQKRSARARALQDSISLLAVSAADPIVTAHGVLAREMVGVTPAATTALGRCVVNSPQVELPLSAAALQTTRLAAISRSSFAFSTGRSVLRIECTPLSKRSKSSDKTAPTLPESDYFLPNARYDITVTLDLQHSAHRSEVMSLTASEDRFASIDSDGVCILSIGSQPGESSSCILQPPSLSSGEAGWAGVAFQSSDIAIVATARQFHRDVSFYDRDIRVRTLHALVEPTALSFVGSSGTLAVAEGSALAMYDPRSHERASCIARKLPTSSNLLALDATLDGNSVAVAGKDRTVHVLDTRTMTFRDRWPACLKYECAGLKLSRCNKGMVYVCGVDNEFAYGAWDSEVAGAFRGNESLMLSGANTKSPRRAHGFRGDARITGMDSICDKDGELLAAMSEVGAFYIVEIN
jgi:WD40 repeat protein